MTHVAWIPAVVGFIAMIAITSGQAVAGGPTQAQLALAQELGLDVREITIARTEPVEFTDGCMGLADLRTTCDRLGLVTSGTVTWLVVGEEAWRYHGSDEFQALGLASGPFPAAMVASAPLPDGTRASLPGTLPSTGSGGLAEGAGDVPAAATAAGVAAAMVAVALIGLGLRRVRR